MKPTTNQIIGGAVIVLLVLMIIVLQTTSAGIQHARKIRAYSCAEGCFFAIVDSPTNRCPVPSDEEYNKELKYCADRCSFEFDEEEKRWVYFSNEKPDLLIKDEVVE